MGPVDAYYCSASFENTLLCLSCFRILSPALSRCDAKDYIKIPCCLRHKSTWLRFPHLDAPREGMDEEGSNARMWSYRDPFPGKCGGRGILVLLCLRWWRVWYPVLRMLRAGQWWVVVVVFSIEHLAGRWALLLCVLLLAI